MGIYSDRVFRIGVSRTTATATVWSRGGASVSGRTCHSRVTLEACARLKQEVFAVKHGLDQILLEGPLPPSEEGGWQWEISDGKWMLARHDYDPRISTMDIVPPSGPIHTAGREQMT